MELCPLGGCHPSATLTGAVTEGTYVDSTPEDSDDISADTAPQSWAQQALTELESQPLSQAWAWVFIVCQGVEAKPGDPAHRAIGRLDCSPSLHPTLISTNVSRTVGNSWVIEQ